MGFISQDVLNEIREKADIVEVIGSYVPLTQRGKNYFCVCPFHDDHSPSMSIQSEKQIYRCWSCGAAGNVFTFVQNFENITFPEAAAKLAQRVGIPLDVKTVPTKSTNRFQKEYEVMDLAEKFYSNNINTKEGCLAKAYLQQRGLTEDIIKEFHIGLSLDRPDDLSKLLQQKGYQPQMLYGIGLVNKNEQGEIYDLFRGRILFPLWNPDGQAVGFSGRIYREEKTAKYINTKETDIFKKGQMLYNYHNAKMHAKKENYLLVVEGQMDAIRIYSNGIKNVVALMGSTMTKDQVELLKKLRVPIYLCLDSDAAGQRAMLSIGKELEKAKIEVNVIAMSGAKDPDEYILKNGLEAYQKCLQSPIKFFDFKLKVLKNNKDLGKSDDLTNYINEVLHELSEETDPIKIEVVLTKLSEEYNISSEILKEKLQTLSKNVTIKPVPKKEILVPKRKTKFELALDQIIYDMMNDSIYIKLYQKQLGYLPVKEYRELVSEILYYYDRNKSINLADFITYITLKGKKVDTFQRIIAANEKSKMSEEEFLENIEIIKKESNKIEIKQIKEQLKNELDENKKITLLEKLTKLKKGSV